MGPCFPRPTAHPSLPLPSTPPPLQAVALASSPDLDAELVRAAKYRLPDTTASPSADLMVHAKGVGRPPLTASSPFVKTAGTDFVVAGQKVVFAGTNAFYLLLDSTSDADVLKFFEVRAALVLGRDWGRGRRLGGAVGC